MPSLIARLRFYRLHPRLTAEEVGIGYVLLADAAAEIERLRKRLAEIARIAEDK